MSTEPLMNPQGPYDPNNPGPTPMPPPQPPTGEPYDQPGNAYGQPTAPYGQPPPPYGRPGTPPYHHPGVDPPPPPNYYGAPNPYGVPYGAPPRQQKTVLWPIFLVVGILAVMIIPGIYLAGVSRMVGGRLQHNGESLATARAGFVTHLTAQNRTPDPIPNPPEGFHIVRYPAPLGSFPALIANPTGTAAAQANGKHPLVIWITGGFSNSIDDTPWQPQTPDNDQSASAFHLAGLPTMYPSLRGGNGNPGYVETCYGEVDDIIAAAKYAAAQPDIDPNRIYLAGHSTGGTNALLTAESTGMFRAVFCFGPIDDTARYGSDQVSYDVDNDRERSLRAPIEWLDSIKTPTFVIEGDSETSANIGPLRRMRDQCTNPNVHFIEVPNADHFSELARTTPVIARKIVADTGPTCNIAVDESDWPS